MATPGALQPQIRDIVAAGGLVPGGMIPFRDTIFLWQSLVSVLVEIVVVVFVMYLATPPAAKAKTASMLGVDLRKSAIQAPPSPRAPFRRAARLEHSPMLNLLDCRDRRDLHRSLLRPRAEPLNAITLNILNLSFLMVGVLLHRTPARLMYAVQAATPAVWGVMLQFPFYAGIAAIITTTHLNERLANAFVSISSPEVSRRSSRSIQRCLECSCRRADRSGSSRRRT